jgi:hypothetical protein
MEEILKKYKENFPELLIEAKDYHYKFLDGREESGTYYIITGFEGNKDIQLRFDSQEEANRVYELAEKKPYIFPDFLAVRCGDVIEVLLTSITFRMNFRNAENDEGSYTKFLELSLPYYKNDLLIEFEEGQNEENTLPKILEFVRGGGRYSRRRSTILKIHNYKKPTSEGVVNDVRNIINSVLFDVECSYDLAFETVNIEGLLRSPIRRHRKRNELPNEPINLVYKKYIPELIQYFHTAEKVDFLPFKYITYYHILEYFSDKSAYKVVSDEVKKLLLKPDFHTKTNHYINQAVNIFKKENEKHTTDKIKIERVLNQFVNRQELKETLSDYEIIGHFEKELILDCSKPLVLPAIDFDKEQNFYNNLTKRIYSLRCSIVHSNPDFDESKAIPFSPTPNNIEILRYEMEMIAEIARNIIIESKGE